MASPADWYNSLPPVTKTWATACFALGGGATINLISPKLLYISYDLLFKKFQIWRPLTCCLFLGGFGLKFVSRLLLLLRHGVQLESNTYQGRTADFLYMLIFGIGSMLTVNFIYPMFSFLADPLVYMTVYVWSREFPNSVVNLMGLVSLQAFYLPWAYLALDMVFGLSPFDALVGILVGHLYYFLTTIYPRQSGRNLLKTPLWVHQLLQRCGIASAPTVSFSAAPSFGPRAAPAAAPTAAAPSRSSAFQGRAYRLDRD